jgi:hypothetical protein
MRNALYLWVCCRKTGNIECICGEELLGASKVEDSQSPWDKSLPVPPIMIAQIQLIFYRESRTKPDLTDVPTQLVKVAAWLRSGSGYSPARSPKHE